MKNYAYVRVSSKEQHIDRQTKAIQELNIPIRIFIEKQSGKNFERPQYIELLKN